MTMNVFSKFARSDDGAVTVDWVVMTAAVVGLGIAVLTSVSGGTTGLASTISSELTGMDVGQGDGPFDVSEYVPLTGDANFGAITDATAGQTDDQLRNWGNLAKDIAMDSSKAAGERRQQADTYAARYALLQDRGADVSSMTDPRELAAAVEADLS
jgi:hypothetical protein